MEAVGRKKANWLFNAGSDKSFAGKRRPQEDMVTSAVFGSIRLMSSEDRLTAIELLLGSNSLEAAGFTGVRDIDIELWPRLPGPEGRRHVEPDVLLKAASKTVIVEVKWHAPLSERQLEQQVEAVGAEKVTAVIMLGEAGVGESICDKPCFRRTWRDVSGRLQNWHGDKNSPLGRWVETMCKFLQETDIGRIFNGLPPLQPIEQTAYRFSKPGRPPWFEMRQHSVQKISYRFGAGLC